jgi:glycosyltransferase involved in cell wall biosynthesis
LKIAVNTRFLLGHKLEGFGWFTYETLKRITEQHPEHEFIFLFDRKYDPKFIFSDNITPVVIPPQARHPILLYYLWFEHSVRRALKKHKADVFVSPDGYLSLKSKVKSLAVMHDLNFEHYPNDLPKLHRNYYLRNFPKFARHATRIATVSNFSKQDIVKQYGVSADKIDVVYNGVNEMYGPVNEEIKTATKQKYTGGADYFVFVGSLHPRKNIKRLFEAYDQFRKSTDSTTKLVIVGQKYWWNDEMNQTFEAMQFKNEVIFTGHLSPEELNNVVASAMAMAYVTYFEGFGIPLVEAMKCEIPVITSNVTSLPEVAEDAALYVDPFDVDSITKALTTMNADSNLRADLVVKGRKRVQHFSWQKTADGLWQSILKTAES